MYVVNLKLPLIVVGCLAVAGVSAASAQGAAPRPPSGGVFGATRSDVGARDRLSFTFQLAEGYDSALPPDVNSRVSRGLDIGGWSSVFQASSNYARLGRRLQFMGGASTALKYYRELDRVDAVSHNAVLGAGIKVPGGTVRLEQAAAYSPSYLFQLIPSIVSDELVETTPVSPDYQIEEAESYTYMTKAALSLGSTRGTQLTATGGFNRTDFSEQASSRFDLEVYDAGLKVSRRLSTRASANLGYEFRSGEFGFGGPTTEHIATIGVELSRALSRSRRAAVRLDISPSRIELPEAALSDTLGEPGRQRLNRLSAQAQINVPFRPNWQTAAGYRRSLEYLSVLNEPVLADGAHFVLNGLLTRRIDLTISGGYVEAASAMAPSSDPLQTYTGRVAMRFALNRSVAVSSEYLYYYYDLGAQTGFSPGLPTIFEQHGGRIGMVLFLKPVGR